MRFGFGLVGILVVIGIIAYYWGNVEHPADKIRQGEEIKKEVRQLAGRDETGMSVGESITLEAHNRGGKLDGVVVQNIIAQGPMETYFGLQLDDIIIGANQMRIRDMNNDVELAKAMVLESYQRRLPLTVLRNGQEITLGGEDAAGGNAQGAAKSVQRQIEAIKQGQAPQ